MREAERSMDSTTNDYNTTQSLRALKVKILYFSI